MRRDECFDRCCVDLDMRVEEWLHLRVELGLLPSDDEP